MFYSPKLYLRDPWIRWPLSACSLAQGLIWWFVLSRVHPTNDSIFLHYTIMFGVDLIGNWGQILLPPAVGLSFGVFNFFLSFTVYSASRFTARLLACATVLVQIFLAVGVVLIVGLNS